MAADFLSFRVCVVHFFSRKVVELSARFWAFSIDPLPPSGVVLTADRCQFVIGNEEHVAACEVVDLEERRRVAALAPLPVRTAVAVLRHSLVEPFVRHLSGWSSHRLCDAGMMRPQDSPGRPGQTLSTSLAAHGLEFRAMHHLAGFAPLAFAALTAITER